MDPLTAALAPIRQRCRQPGTPDSALLQAAYAQACDDRERLLRALEMALNNMSWLERRMIARTMACILEEQP